MTLDEALQRAGLQVPACAADGLHYPLFDNGFGYYYTILLRLDAPPSCIDEFVAGNLMTDRAQRSRLQDAAAEKPLPRRPDWMDSRPVRDVGWDLGADQPFQVFSAGNQKGYGTSVLAQHTPDPATVRAYVHSVHAG